MNTGTPPMPDCYFTRDGDGFLPTSLAGNPWYPGAIAGGPTSGLFASVIDDVGLAEGMEVARLSIDILGIVPSARLVPSIHPVRMGKQMQLHRIELHAGDKRVAQAHVLLVRPLETPASLPPCDYTTPEAAAEDNSFVDSPMRRSVTNRRITGNTREPGRGTLWLHLNGQIIGGTEASPFATASMFADYGNGVGNATYAHEWSFANLDITISFLRMPRGKWLLIDAHTEGAGNGHGLAQSQFADRDGIYARVTQTIFVGPAIAGSRFVKSGAPAPIA